MQAEWILKQLYKKRIHYNRLVKSNSLEVIAKLTAHGCGLGILPGSLVFSFYEKKLVPIPKMPLYRDNICLIYRNEDFHKALQVITHSIKKAFTHKNTYSGLN